MDAIDLLKTQHKEVKDLLKKLVEVSGDEGMRLLESLSHTLLAHMIIEQEIFYPAAARAVPGPVDEGYEEHFAAREMISRAMRERRDQLLFHARCKVVKSLLEHHIEEEENVMFPRTKRVLGVEHLRTLGDQMASRFDELEREDLPALARRAENVELLSDARASEERAAPAPSRRVSARTRGGKARAGKVGARRGRTSKKKTAPKRTAKPSARAAGRGSKKASRTRTRW